MVPTTSLRFSTPGNAKSSNSGSESTSIPSFGCTTNSSSRLQVDEVSQIAGRLGNFFPAWSALTSDVFTLSCIQGYRLCFLSPPVQDRPPRCPLLGKREACLMHQAIGNLVHLGAVITCMHCQGQFFSSYFLVKKSNGNMRFVLNLKPLNRFMQTDHFKMEDIRTATKLISHGSYMATLELQDAYFLVPVHKSSRKYLRFLWQNTMYEFQCLLFGLCTAPWVFTKIVKPVATYLRSRGWRSVVYLDDWLLIGDNADECRRNVEATQSLLSSLVSYIRVR